MKHFYATLLAFASMFAASVSAQDLEVVLDLMDRTVFDQCTQTSIKYDHSDYTAWTFNNYGKYPYMYNYNITKPYYSDYLVTPEVELKAGTLYKLETAPAAYNSSEKSKLSIGVGQGDNVETYTVLAAYENITYSSQNNAEVKSIEFNVPADGNYKLYFLGEEYPLYLYKTRLYNAGSSNVPAAVKDLTLLPAADGSASVTVGFTIPEVSISGAPISGEVKYKIYRGESDELIKSDRGNAGDYISYVDNTVTEGTVTYSVEIEYEGELSAKASASTFVGKETPEAVTDLALSKTDNKFTITWNAPEKGIHGAYLDATALTYIVKRYVDDQETVVADALAETSFVDTYSSDELQAVYYTVEAVLNGMASEAVSTKSITLGYLTLPFADSFAGASFGKVWTAEAVKGTFNWVAVETNPYPNQKPAVTKAYDNDGGFAFYNSWNSLKGNSARLASAPLKYVAGTSPVVEFYVFRSAGNDAIKVQVSCDNADWKDVEGAVVTLKGDKSEWEKVTFPIASAITADCSTFRIAFVAESQYGQNTVMDKVRVFVPAEKDLEVSTLIAPTSVYSGNTIDLSFTVANNSVNAVSGADYSLSLVTDYPIELATPESVDIPALGSVTVNVKVPVTAIEAKAANSYSFALKANLEGDENADNDKSDDAVVEVKFVNEASPTNPEAKLLEDNSIEVSWAAAGSGIEPVNVGTSFEGFENGFTGPFDGFTSIDLDEAQGDGYYMASGSAFNIINNQSTPKGKDGSSVIGLTLGAYKQQNDWLISPILNCQEGSTMTLSFLYAMRKFSSSSYYYSMEILYTTESEYDAADPASAFTNKVASKTSSTSYGDFIMSETMKSISFENIPAEAKYIAIHFNTKMSLSNALWIDNISIKEVQTNPLLGYNVYEEGVEKINDELIDAKTTKFNVPATREAGRKFFITAVYGNGESMPSDLTNNISSVKDIDNGNVSVFNTADGLAVKGVNGENVMVFDLQGRCVASVNEDSTLRLASGIYIVKAGATVRKVVVRNSAF